jgi:hypothetical protein
MEIIAVNIHMDSIFHNNTSPHSAPLTSMFAGQVMWYLYSWYLYLVSLLTSQAHPYREQKLGCKTDPQLFF